MTALSEYDPPYIGESIEFWEVSDQGNIGHYRADWGGTAWAVQSYAANKLMPGFDLHDRDWFDKHMDSDNVFIVYSVAVDYLRKLLQSQYFSIMENIRRETRKAEEIYWQLADL